MIFNIGSLLIFSYCLYPLRYVIFCLIFLFPVAIKLDNKWICVSFFKYSFVKVKFNKNVIFLSEYLCRKQFYLNVQKKKQNSGKTLNCWQHKRMRIFHAIIWYVYCRLKIITRFCITYFRWTILDYLAFV